MNRRSIKLPLKLQEFLDSLPLPEPTRIVTSEDGKVIVVEWQVGMDYYEIELENNDLVIMSVRTGIFKHWEINAI